MLDSITFIIFLALVVGLPIGAIGWLIGRKRSRDTQGIIKAISFSLSMILIVLIFTAEDEVAVNTTNSEIVAESVCDLPLTISIGTIDSRFNLTKAQAKDLVQKAELMWEEASERDLFAYVEASSTDVVVNFIYDKRQEKTSERKRYESDSYAYNADAETYEATIKTHQELSVSYESEVDKWNNDSRSSQTQERLDQLKQMENQLLVLVEQINAWRATLENRRQILERRRLSLDDESHFSGWFDGFNTISIYSYNNQKELVNTLAHEMGHALGVGHIDDPNSIMNENASPKQSINESDLEALTTALQWLRPICSK